MYFLKFRQILYYLILSTKRERERERVSKKERKKRKKKFYIFSLFFYRY